MYPRQSPTTHTEQLGAEASVYDWARGRVHALNPTAGCVWRHCDGVTSRDAIAAALRAELGIPEAEAVVDLTLAHLARVHLLEIPVESHVDRSTPTRRWLLGRGLTAALLPAIYSIVAPSPVDAQSVGAATPTLTSLSPNQGGLGNTVTVTLTGTNFVVGATTVTVNSGGVTASNVIVSSATSLTVDIAIAANATTGAHTVTVTTAGGTTGAQTFTVSAAPPPPAPTLTSIAPNQGVLSSTVTVMLTGTNFVVGATTVAVSGSGLTVSNIVVSSTTSLTADFAIAVAAATGARTVTVTTAGGTSAAQTFTVNAPAPGAPTLTTVLPNQGVTGNTVAVTLTGTNFVIGATTVAVSGLNVAVSNIVVSSATSLTADFAIAGGAALGARTVTVTTASGTSAPQTFTVNPPAPTLTSITPPQNIRGATVAVTLTGTNFVTGATTVTVGGGSDITVNTVVVSNTTSLTANFVLALSSLGGARTVTVTTAGGTSGQQTFTITLPAPGSMTFTFTATAQTFVVPAGVVAVTIDALGAAGIDGFAGLGGPSGAGGLGGRTTATLSVTPGTSLTVNVGSRGLIGSGGFNGGGDSSQLGGGGGGASTVLNGTTPLVVAGGGGGGGAGAGAGVPGGAGGAGGGLSAGGGANAPTGGGGGGAGTQSAGGVGGTGVPGIGGTPGMADTGGVGGAFGGGGGGGGHFGGGGGGGGAFGAGGGGGGGGGSSYSVPGATAFMHQPGVNSVGGSVTISW